MKIAGVNERMAQILKILNDDSERILTSKMIENRFQISNFTARSDLKSLLKMGFIDVIQVNKKTQNFVKSSNFNKVLLEFLKEK